MTLKTARNTLLALCTLLLGASSASAFPAETYRSSSALASGRWVKIRVSSEGLYQISYDQLRQWGFSDPSRVGVYGYGGAALAQMKHQAINPDDVNRNYAYHDDANSRLFFYGEGPSKAMVPSLSYMEYRRNNYSDYGYYFLSDSEALAVPDDFDFAPDDSHRKFRTSMCGYVVENDIQNPVGYGMVWLDRSLSPGESTTLVFPLKDYDDSEYDESERKLAVNFNFAAAGYTGGRFLVTTPDGNIDALQKNEPKTSQLVSDTRKHFMTKGYFYGAPNADFPAGGNARITFTCDPSLSPTLCALDWASLQYPRRNRCNDDGTALITDRNQGNDYTDFIYENASPTTVLLDASFAWDVRRRNAVYDADTRELTGGYGRYVNNLPNQSHRFIAFDPAVCPEGLTPEYVGEVANQNIHAAPTPGMLIITTRALREAAQELADIHAQHGLNCLVVTQEEVYNEFSSGTPTPFAYNRCAKMFYDRDPETFRYVLLYGASTGDPRGINSPYKDDIILTFGAQDTYFSGETTTAYCHDGFVGMLRDDFDCLYIHKFGHDVAVGRVTPRDPGAARAYNGKVSKYLDNPPSVDNFMQAIMISDDGNNTQHLKNAIEAMEKMQEIQPALTYIQVPNLVYPWTGNIALEARSLTQRALNRGAGFFSYTGHGSALNLTNENLWNRSVVASSSYGVHPLGLLVTCDSYAYDHETEDLTQDMVLKPDGGCIGIIAGSRSVYLDLNQDFNVACSRAYASATAGTTIGDIYRQAHSDYVSKHSIQSYVVNTMCFNFCGDPAVPVSAPSHKIFFEKLDSKDISMYNAGQKPSTSSILPVIAPLKTSVISGHVNDAQGNAATSFNGTATVTVYDSPHTVPVVIKNEKDKYTVAATDLHEITMDQDVLTRVTVPVTDGRFEASFVCPVPTFPGTYNRIVVTATGDDGSNAAAMYAMCRVSDTPSGDAVTAAAPTIDEMTVSAPDGTTPDFFGNEVTVRALISTSELGLRLGDAIGAAPTLTIDANDVIADIAPYITADADDPSRYILAVPVSELAAGYHSAELIVSDNAGQTARADVSFYVSDNSAATLSIAAADPADRSSVTLECTHPLSVVENSRLIISDALGNTVFTVANPAFPYRWNLTATDGSPVADGHYNATVVLSGAGAGASSPRLSIPVVR